MLAKVGKLLEINQDLIKAREEDLEKRGQATDNGNQNQAPKVVMQVHPGHELFFRLSHNVPDSWAVELITNVSRGHQNQKLNF